MNALRISLMVIGLIGAILTIPTRPGIFMVLCGFFLLMFVVGMLLPGSRKGPQETRTD